MKGKLKYLGVLASLALAVLVGVPADAEAFDVAFYELSENATFAFDETTGGFKRVASEGALAGEAQVGTPLCPRRLVRELVAAGLMRDRTPCYVTATRASDEINALGAGSLQATIQVKVQLDNPFDAPELVVMVAHIEGQLQVIDALPLIMISGTVMTTHVLDTSTFSLVEVSGPAKQFTGTVRLPFVIEQDGTSRKPRRGETAFYLADDFVTLIPVQSNERSLGLPTARFELNF